MQTTPPNHFVTIQALNEMIVTEKKFREDISVFVQLMQESASEVKDPALKKLIEEYIAPYQALRDAGALVDDDLLTADSSADKISSTINKIKSSFKASSICMAKNKAALAKCAAQKTTFQSFIVGLFSVKKPFYDIFTKSFVDILNKKYFYARENNVVNRNKESTNAQDWVLSNIMKPVQVSMRYQMPLEAISHFVTKQRLAGKPLPYEIAIHETLIDAKSIAADVNKSVIAPEKAILPKNPEVTKERPIQKIDKHTVKKDYSNHSLHRENKSEKDTSKTVKVDLNSKVGIIKEILKQKYPEKTHIKLLETIRKAVDGNNEQAFAKIQTLARNELRINVSFLAVENAKSDSAIRPLLRCIASGDIEKLKQQLEQKPTFTKK